MIAPAAVTGVILAGGRGRRMGGAIKAMLPIEGRTILERLVGALEPVCAEVIVSVRSLDQIDTPLRRVVDDIADAGPLAGIAAALAASARPWLIAVGGDMPDVRTDVLELLLAHAGPGVDAVAPLVAGLPEPLCAIYGARCLDAARRRLAEGRFKTSGLLTDEGLAVAWVGEHLVRAVDPDLRSLRNVNRPDDLARS